LPIVKIFDCNVLAESGEGKIKNTEDRKVSATLYANIESLHYCGLEEVVVSVQSVFNNRIIRI